MQFNRLSYEHHYATAATAAVAAAAAAAAAASQARVKSICHALRLAASSNSISKDLWRDTTFSDGLIGVAPSRHLRPLSARDGLPLPTLMLVL